MGGKGSKVEYEELDLTHFRLHEVIGKGGFGLVRIVEERKTKNQYALKYINKKECIKKDAVDNVFRERLIMQELNHPFICNLRFAFQDDEYMFIGLDLAVGGDVRFHLLRQKGLTEQTVKIYSAEIAQALDYIHKRHIIHRDLKPENLLIDAEGHVRITDFNVAAWTLNKFPSSRSGTLCYMAPEMLSGKPYGYAVDWWALGVVMYECFYGVKPFRSSDEDKKVTHAIRHSEPELPPKDKGLRGNSKPDASEILKDIIQRFLIKNKDSRLGSQPDAFETAISKEPFYSDIDWSALYERKILPDFIPDMSKSNFEAAPAIEELLFDSAPLTPKRRKKRSPSALAGKSTGSLSRNGSVNSANNSDTEIDFSKLTVKQQIKEHTKRQMQFIDEKFTVYVQALEIGLLDRNDIGVPLDPETETLASSPGPGLTTSVSIDSMKKVDSNVSLPPNSLPEKSSLINVSAPSQQGNKRSLQADLEAMNVEPI
eukprot:jgi/Hompol1/777/HPOL_005406-RA